MDFVAEVEEEVKSDKYADEYAGIAASAEQAEVKASSARVSLGSLHEAARNAPEHERSAILASIAAAEREAFEATESAKAWRAKRADAKRAADKKAAAEKAAAEAAAWEAERQAEAQAANAQADGDDSPDGEPDELRAALNEIAPKRQNWGGVASAMREHFQQDDDGAGFALFEEWRSERQKMMKL